MLGFHRAHREARAGLRRDPLRGLAGPAQRPVDPGRAGAGARHAPQGAGPDHRRRPHRRRRPRARTGGQLRGRPAAARLRLREGDERPAPGRHRGARGRGARAPLRRPARRARQALPLPDRERAHPGTALAPAGLAGVPPPRRRGHARRRGAPPRPPRLRGVPGGRLRGPERGPRAAAPRRARRGRRAHRGGGRGHRLPEAHGAKPGGHARRGGAGSAGARLDGPAARRPGPDAGRPHRAAAGAPAGGGILRGVQALHGPPDGNPSARAISRALSWKIRPFLGPMRRSCFSTSPSCSSRGSA